MNIYISGASGFVGKVLCSELSGRGHQVVPLVRRLSAFNNAVFVSDLGDSLSVEDAIQGCDVFIHLAARVHQMGEDPRGAKEQYQLVNRELTLLLAKAALKAGAQHFIFMSSVKVAGEMSRLSCALVEGSSPRPEDPYAQSKWDAEQDLMEFAASSGMSVTILRPPLIYGPGVKANFLSLMRWLSNSLPTPFKLIKNKRSFLYTANLTSAIARCIEIGPRRSGIYFLSDGEDLSSYQLGSKLCKSLNCFYFSLPVPDFLLKLVGRCLGKTPQVNRLLSSLQVSNELFCRDFDWTPPYSVDEGLRDTATWFRGERSIQRMNHFKRVVDVMICIFALCTLCVPLVLIALIVKLTSKGPVLYWSDRVGAHNQIFSMPKFRSMRVGTPVVATHLLESPDAHLTPVGGLLRRSSLDELPQLLCILRGTMSWVGPRPALYNQYDLISLRTQTGVDRLVPGITGWAQINGRDELEIAEKVQYDLEYLVKRSFLFDMKILWLTFFKVLFHKNIAH